MVFNWLKKLFNEDFIEVSRSGDLQRVSLLLANGADPNQMGMFTALIYAAGRDDVEMIHLLLDGGADINLGDPQAYTPLMYAAWYGKVTAVKYLLERGANPNLKTTTGYTALSLAERIFHPGRIAVDMATGSAIDYEDPESLKYKEERHRKIIGLLKAYGAK